MTAERYRLIHEYMQEILYISDENEFISVTENYADRLGFERDTEPSDENIMAGRIWEDAKNLGTVMMHLKAGSPDSVNSAKLNSLSDDEKAELAEVEGIIRGNRFDYHFQPIVSAEDGEIYSYEALMRPRSDMKISPFHIIKYSDMTDRLNDIELATFLNVLTIIDSHKELFFGRKVFINSIPRARLPAGDLLRIDELLRVHSDTAVVEMTEQTESDEPHFAEMKERYGRMNIKTALDDYGTGYSNVRNILRYSPDYVKIDRSLLSDISNSPQKRHFVREIIEFCHDNNILALAEGVETEDELRSVIILGADLIQGFYTARPAAKIIESIPSEIKQQIIHFRQERQDGVDHHIYYPEDGEHLHLDKLARDEYNCILAGRDESSGDVTVTGVPSRSSNIHIETSADYKGTITLDNANLSNVKGRPCIDIGENSRVKLIIKGENTLNKGGIRVPEGAELVIEGTGSVKIRLDASEYYGIGNDFASKHGKITLNQSGVIMIDAAGQKGICIGAGKGGEMHLLCGQYILNINSDIAVGVGSFYENSDLEITNCDFSADMSVTKGAAIGSLDYNSKVHISKASVKLYLAGREIAAIGNISGEKADIVIDNANTLINLTADRSTSAGALNGSTSFSVENATLRIVGSGEKMFVFGGVTGDTKVSLINADTGVRVLTAFDFRNLIPAENIKIVSGRTHFTRNNEDVKLKTE